MTLIELVKAFEGFHRVPHLIEPISAIPYLCPAGFWTIGYGHLCREDHARISEREGELYLIGDLASSRAAVDALISWPLTGNQRDALTSWTFNLGPGRLRGSTLRAAINRGDLASAPNEIRRWVYAGGRKLPGLVLRREAEAALFTGNA